MTHQAISHSKRHQPIIWITVLAFSAVIAYFCMLTARPLNNPDESRYTEIALEMLQSHDFISPRFNGVLFLDKPPLYYWLQASAVKLFGQNVYAYRFFPAVFALFGCFMTFVTTRRLFGRNEGLLGSAILLSSPLYFFIGLYANLDMEVAVLISSALLVFSLALFDSESRQQQKLFFRLAYLFSGFAFLTKGMIGLALPMISVGLWLLLSKQWHQLKKMCIPSGLAIIFAINAPWYYLVETKNPGFLSFFFYEQQVHRFIGSHFNAHNPWYFYIVLILAGMMPWSVFVLQSLRFHFKRLVHSDKDRLKIIYFISWFVAITLFFSIPSSKLASYIIPSLPPLAILYALYLARTHKENPNIHYAYKTLNLILFTLLSALIYFKMTSSSVPLLGYYKVLMALGVLLVFSFSYLRFKQTHYVLCNLFVGSFAFNCLLTSAVPDWIEHFASRKPTIASTEKLASFFKHKSLKKVYSYQNFYYDLPILLHKPIYVVYDWQQANLIQNDSWAGKFAFGQMMEQRRQQQKKNRYLVNKKAFWQAWNKSQPIWVITRRENLKDFKHYRLVAKHKRNVIITNR